MREIILISSMAMLLLAGCTSSKKATQSAGNSTTASVNDASRDGSSFEKAIIIQEKSETPGVSAEYKWLKENYPGYTFLGQSLINSNKKPYDVLKIKTADGAEKSIYFDISNFFGKF